MEKKVQDHRQEMDLLDQTTELEKAQLIHESMLKREMKAVSKGE